MIERVENYVQAVEIFFTTLLIIRLLLEFITFGTCRDCGAPLMRGTLCGSYECKRRRLLRRLELMLVEGDLEELDEMFFCIEPAVKVMGD